MGFQQHRMGNWLFNKMIGVSSLIQNIPNSITPAPFRLMQIGSSFWQSRVLYVAAKLDIATMLANKQLYVETLAENLAVNADALYRLMRMLVAMGLFKEVSIRTFENNALSNCLREGNANNIRPMILMHNSPEMSRPWYESLEQGIVSGAVPFEQTHGLSLFDYMDAHPDFDRMFAEAMDSVDALTEYDVIADDFDWSNCNRVIDIGGSRGSKAIAVLKKHTHIKALILDRPQVIAAAQTFWADKLEPSLLGRMDFVAADMCTSVPAAESDKDIYMLNAVLHGLDNENCIQVLSSLAKACGGTKAHIVINEVVLPEKKVNITGASFDMQMLMATAGRERTKTEYATLFEASGLVLVEEVQTRSFVTMMVLSHA